MSENFKTCFVQFVKLKLIYKGENFDALAFLNREFVSVGQMLPWLRHKTHKFLLLVPSNFVSLTLGEQYNVF
jgi:hypothetical protein